jgi:hypothetical protein
VVVEAVVETVVTTLVAAVVAQAVAAVVVAVVAEVEADLAGMVAEDVRTIAAGASLDLAMRRVPLISEPVKDLNTLN